MLIVSESGLFTMIPRGREAVEPGTLPHRFRRWVMGEVLPTIRQTGHYSIPDAAPSRARALPEIDRVQIIREVRHTFGKREAQMAWLGLHLPVFWAMLASMRQDDLF